MEDNTLASWDIGWHPPFPDIFCFIVFQIQMLKGGSRKKISFVGHRLAPSIPRYILFCFLTLKVPFHYIRPMITIPSNPIPSNAIPSHPVPSSPVQYAKFESIRYFIDIDILQNCHFPKSPYRYRYFWNCLIDIDIDIFKNDHIDIDIDIDIFQKCRYIDNRYFMSIF